MKVCTALPGAGQPCAPSQGTAARCAAEAYCNASSQCVARPSLGQACTTGGDNCAPGSRCVAPSGTSIGVCRRVREEGQSCTDPNDSCAVATTCTAGVCVASGLLGLAGTCVP